MVMIAAGRDERRAGAHALHHLKSEHAAIKSERAIEIGDLEMNMPDAGACNDGWIFGHALSMDLNAIAAIYAAFIHHARSDTSPSGRPNSKVFSVIETMV